MAVRGGAPGGDIRAPPLAATNKGTALPTLTG
jgi:hypothetical protein